MIRRMLTTCLAAMFLAPAVALAQVNVGPQGNWADDFDFGIGGRVTIGLPVEDYPLEVIGSFDYFFPDTDTGTDVDYWEINGNVAYLIPVENERILPYAGAGLNFAHVSVDTDTPGLGGSDSEVGLNLLGGIKFPMRNVMPFGEIRFELGGGEQFVLTAGAAFNVGPGPQ